TWSHLARKWAAPTALNLSLSSTRITLAPAARIRVATASASSPRRAKSNHKPATFGFRPVRGGPRGHVRPKSQSPTISLNEIASDSAELGAEAASTQYRLRSNG